MAEKGNMSNGRTVALDAASLFAEHGGYIRAIIRFHVKNEFQVEDLYQEFFLTLLVKPIPANVESVRAYLYRAITNDVIDAGRRESRRQKNLRLFSERARNSIQIEEPGDAIEETEEKDSILSHWLRQLRGREAEAIRLRYRDSRSIDEIAREMGVDNATVSHYLSRGLKKLRRNCALE